MRCSFTGPAPSVIFHHERAFLLEWLANRKLSTNGLVGSDGRDCGQLVGKSEVGNPGRIGTMYTIADKTSASDERIDKLSAEERVPRLRKVVPKTNVY